MKQHAATWLGDICIALLFTMLAWWLRQMGYPLCPGDEAVWLQISRTLDAGQTWPVSGPGFMLAVQTLGEQLGRPTTEAIGLWGIGSVFGAVLVMLRVYRQLEPLRPWVICTSLAMSTYFLAPLLESRPQQWGQVLVLLGSWLCWRWLHARGGWSFFVVLLLTAYLHILSHAVLLAVCIGLMLGDVLLGQVRTPARQQRHLVVWLALLLSFGVYLLPAGPYARMLLDIHQHHLAKFSLFVPIACSLLGMALLPFFYRRQALHTLLNIKPRLQGLAQRRGPGMLMLTAVVALALAAQAALLPAEAWRPYGGSVASFVLFQLGNLSIVFAFIAGLLVCLHPQSEQRFSPLAAQFLLLTLLSLTVVAGLSMLASLWLLHTNWLLRLMNYGLLFAAPVVAIGLQAMTQRWPRWLRACLLAAGMALSLLAVLKPSPLFSC